MQDEESSDGVDGDAYQKKRLTEQSVSSGQPQEGQILTLTRLRDAESSRCDGSPIKVNRMQAEKATRTKTAACP